jgi:transcription elongation GreA/GreB family factor
MKNVIKFVNYFSFMKMTKQRQLQLINKLEVLKQQLLQIDSDVKMLVEEGKGWRFNNQLGEAIDKQKELQNKIKQLEAYLLEVEVNDNPIAHNIVSVGSTVDIENNDGIKKTITIVEVGSLDLDPRAGIISEKSPLAILLLGKKLGENIEMNNKSLTIKKIY